MIVRGLHDLGESALVDLLVVREIPCGDACVRLLRRFRLLGGLGRLRRLRSMLGVGDAAGVVAFPAGLPDCSYSAVAIRRSAWTRSAHPSPPRGAAPPRPGGGSGGRIRSSSARLQRAAPGAVAADHGGEGRGTVPRRPPGVLDRGGSGVRGEEAPHVLPHLGAAAVLHLRSVGLPARRGEDPGPHGPGAALQGGDGGPAVLPRPGSGERSHSPGERQLISRDRGSSAPVRARSDRDGVPSSGGDGRGLAPPRLRDCSICGTPSNGRPATVVSGHDDSPGRPSRHL